MTMAINASDLGHGMREVKVDTWADFVQYMHDAEMLNEDLVFRGQRDAAWELESSIDRLARALNMGPLDARGWQLSRFTQAVLGRHIPQLPGNPTDEYWWQLGQHMGLATPLLDWTRAPFLAAFFAFAEKQCSGSGHRAVFAAETQQIDVVNARARTMGSRGEDQARFFALPVHDNPRVLSQRGVFSHRTLPGTLEGWLRTWTPAETREPYLTKVLISEDVRATAIRALHRMNVTYLSLFPDVHGAALHSNLLLEFPGLT
jgi:hypothetical protein